MTHSQAYFHILSALKSCFGTLSCTENDRTFQFMLLYCSMCEEFYAALDLDEYNVRRHLDDTSEFVRLDTLLANDSREVMQCHWSRRLH